MSGSGVDPTGLEVVCSVAEHGACRKNVSFAHFESQDDASKWLKYWLITGGLFRTSLEHLEAEMPEIRFMPSSEKLDETPFQRYNFLVSRGRKRRGASKT